MPACFRERTGIGPERAWSRQRMCSDLLHQRVRPRPEAAQLLTLPASHHCGRGAHPASASSGWLHAAPGSPYSLIGPFFTLLPVFQRPPPKRPLWLRKGHVAPAVHAGWGREGRITVPFWDYILSRGLAVL